MLRIKPLNAVLNILIRSRTQYPLEPLSHQDQKIVVRHPQNENAVWANQPTKTRPEFCNLWLIVNHIYQRHGVKVFRQRTHIRSSRAYRPKSIVLFSPFTFSPRYIVYYQRKVRPTLLQSCHQMTFRTTNIKNRPVNWNAAA